MPLTMSTRKFRYVIIVLGLLVAVYAVFSKTINNKAGLLYLKIINTEAVKINNISIKVPYKYVRKIEPTDVTFTDYPDGEGTIIVRSRFVYDLNKYVDNYLRHIESNNYQIIETGKVIIGGAQGYLIKSGHSSQKDIQEVTILIPDKQVMINYKGKGRKWDEYFTIVETIRFVK